MTGELVGVLDVGGTHVTAAQVRLPDVRIQPGSRTRLALDPDAGREEILAVLGRAARAVHTPRVRRWGVSVPGPFDYAAGVARFAGVGKFESLYGVDVRAELARHVPDAGTIAFLNDASAFLLGEWRAGAARGHRTCVGLTLGTGVGSAFLHAGTIVEEHPDVPSEGRVDLLRYDGAEIEETFSRRALLRAYGAGAASDFDVKELIERAGEGEARARAVLDTATRALGDTIAPWLARFAPSCLVIGGSIARGWPLLEPVLTACFAGLPALRHIAPTQLGDDAALLGAAHHAVDSEQGASAHVQDAHS